MVFFVYQPSQTTSPDASEKVTSWLLTGGIRPYARCHISSSDNAQTVAQTL